MSYAGYFFNPALKLSKLFFKVFEKPQDTEVFFYIAVEVIEIAPKKEYKHFEKRFCFDFRLSHKRFT